MTICVAALFKWNTDQGSDLAAMVLTDRMITAGDLQYEPQQTKVATITPRAIVVIAGDYSLHSQAIQFTGEHFKSAATAPPLAIATFYGRRIQKIKLKEAEDLYLAPLGLNSDSFIAQQKDMTSNFVSMLTDQMQSYRGAEVDALVIGSAGDFVQIYGVDTKGMVSCHNDVGFAAIGIGAWHARSRLMQFGYTNNTSFPRAAFESFAAKKAAEIAPGVGTHTDITMVFKNGSEPMLDGMVSKLISLYDDSLPKVEQLDK